MAKLGKYLKDQRLTQAEFALRIGVRQSSVSKMVSGDASPSLEVAIKIEDETGGEVGVREWVPSAANAAKEPADIGAVVEGGRS